MIVYTVHEPSTPAGAALEQADRVIFIKDGFAWLAAFPYTSVFWLLSHRLWVLAAGYVAVVAVIIAGMSWIAGMRDMGGLALLLLHLLLGFEGNGLRRWSLDRQGYRMVGVASGRTVEECERRFFDGWFGAAKARAGAEPVVAEAVNAGLQGTTGQQVSASLGDRLAATSAAVRDVVWPGLIHLNLAG